MTRILALLIAACLSVTMLNSVVAETISIDVQDDGAPLSNSLFKLECNEQSHFASSDVEGVVMFIIPDTDDPAICDVSIIDDAGNEKYASNLEARGFDQSFSLRLNSQSHYAGDTSVLLYGVDHEENHVSAYLRVSSLKNGTFIYSVSKGSGAFDVYLKMDHTFSNEEAESGTTTSFGQSIHFLAVWPSVKGSGVDFTSVQHHDTAVNPEPAEIVIDDTLILSIPEQNTGTHFPEILNIRLSVNVYGSVNVYYGDSSSVHASEPGNGNPWPVHLTVTWS